MTAHDPRWHVPTLVALLCSLATPGCTIEVAKSEGDDSVDDESSSRTSGTDDTHDGTSTTATTSGSTDSGDGGSLGSAETSESDGTVGVSEGSDNDDASGSESESDGPEPPEGGIIPLPDDDGHGVTGDLTLLVTAAQTPAVPGQSLIYTITVGNRGNGTVNGVEVMLRVPTGLDFSATAESDPNASGCFGSCSANEEATWILGSLAPGRTQTIVVHAAVTNAAVTNVNTLVRLSATGHNPVTITKTSPVVNSPTAEIALVASADPAVPGQSVEIEIDVGHLNVPNISEGLLRLELPGGLNVSSIGDGGIEIPQIDGTSIVEWDVGPLPVNASLHRAIVATVSEAVVPGGILNPRATFVYNDESDATHVAQIPIGVIGAAPPLSLTVTSNPSPAAPNGLLYYEATLVNNSPFPLQSTELVLSVPWELDFNSSTQAEPNATGCFGTCSSRDEARWTIASLASGQQQTIVIHPRVLGTNASGSLVNAIFVLRNPDVNTSIRRESVPIYSASSSQLVIGTFVEPVTPGQTFTYDLHVGNIGAIALSSAQLEAVLPDGVSVTQVSGGGNETNGVVTWSLGTVPVNTTTSRTVTVAVDGDVTPGTVLEASASLRYQEGLLDPSLDLDASSEFALSTLGSPPPVGVSYGAELNGSNRILYTATLQNVSNGPIDALGLVFHVPVGVDFSPTTDAEPDATGCFGTCSAEEEALWTIGTLVPGGSETVEVNARLLAPLNNAALGSLVTARKRLASPALLGPIGLQVTIPAHPNP